MNMAKVVRRVEQGIWLLNDGRYLAIKQFNHPVSGRPAKREITVDTLNEARDFRASALLTHVGQRSSDDTLLEWMTLWLNSKKGVLAKTTYLRYLDSLKRLTALIGHNKLSAIDSVLLKRIQADMAQTYARPTVNSDFRVLHTCLQDATDASMIPFNPVSKIKALRESPPAGRRARSLEPEEYKRLWDKLQELKANGEYSEDIIRGIQVLMLTGMRAGELCALQWKSITDSKLFVEASYSLGDVKDTKTRTRRSVPLFPQLKEILEEQDAWLESTKHPGRVSGLVFPASEIGSRIGASRRQHSERRWHRPYSVYAYTLIEITKLADVPDISLHSLRRTFEDVLRHAGADYIVRRSMAGWHSSRAQEIYATVSNDERKSAIDRAMELVDLKTHHTPDHTPAK